MLPSAWRNGPVPSSTPHRLSAVAGNRSEEGPPDRLVGVTASRGVTGTERSATVSSPVRPLSVRAESVSGATIGRSVGRVHGEDSTRRERPGRANPVAGRQMPWEAEPADATWWSIWSPRHSCSRGALHCPEEERPTAERSPRNAPPESGSSPDESRDSPSSTGEVPKPRQATVRGSSGTY
jgi:hypothetical protein